ncbi:MAG: hypothetical protein ABSF97_07860 [Candidatus Sulfotelmatobacter sp.]|jgi:hypothetical protein
MSCILKASGTCFDVDEFLKVSSLDALNAFHCGETQLPISSVSRTSQSAGVSVSVGAAEFSDLNSQIEDAVEFLTANEKELTRLRNFPGLERISLDFAVENRDMVFQSDAFPPHLLLLLARLNIGLVVSRYPAFDRGENQEATEQ